MDCFSFADVGSPEDPGTVAGKPFGRLANKFSVFVTRNIVSLAVAPSHNPAAPMPIVFLTAYFPKQHAVLATVLMVKFALTVYQRRSRNAASGCEAPSKDPNRPKKKARRDRKRAFNAHLVVATLERCEYGC